MVDWEKTELIEFMGHSKCQRDQACKALAGFEYPVNSGREIELLKLWLVKNLLNKYSWQSIEEFIDSAVEAGLPPPWLDFAIEQGMYTPKEQIMQAISSSNEEIKIADKMNLDKPNIDESLAALFDGVTIHALEKMFPAADRWKNWATRASRNGLKDSRQGRAMYNPYKAASWFLNQRVSGWDLARIHRALKINLPTRSKDEAHLLLDIVE